MKVVSEEDISHNVSKKSSPIDKCRPLDRVNSSLKGGNSTRGSTKKSRIPTKKKKTTKTMASSTILPGLHAGQSMTAHMGPSINKVGSVK